MINVLDPGVIVLGGSLSNVARLYEKVPIASVLRQIETPMSMAV